MKHTLIIMLAIFLFSSCKKDKKNSVEEPAPATPVATTPTFYSFAGDIGANDNSSLLTNDNNLVVCGNYDSGNYNNKACYFKLSKTGAQIWRKEYSVGFQGEISGIVESNAQELFLCGSTTKNANKQILLVKANSLGDTLWTKTYGGGGSDYGYQIIKSADGNLVISGTTDYDFSLTKLNTNGDTIWRKVYPAPDQDIPFHLLQTQNGEFLITGVNGLPSQLYILKVDASGNKLWDKKIGTADWKWGHSTIELANGDLMICGKHTSGGHNQILLVKTDPLGNSYWEKEFGNANINETAYVIKKNADGTLILTGEADDQSASKVNVLLLKVDQSGNQIFFNRFSDAVSRRGINLLKDSNDDNIITGAIFGTGTIFMTKTDKDGAYK